MNVAAATAENRAILVHSFTERHRNEPSRGRAEKKQGLAKELLLFQEFLACNFLWMLVNARCQDAPTDVGHALL